MAVQRNIYPYKMHIVKLPPAAHNTVSLSYNIRIINIMLLFSIFSIKSCTSLVRHSMSLSFDIGTVLYGDKIIMVA